MEVPVSHAGSSGSSHLSQPGSSGGREGGRAGWSRHWAAPPGQPRAPTPCSLCMGSSEGQLSPSIQKTNKQPPPVTSLSEFYLGPRNLGWGLKHQLQSFLPAFSLQHPKLAESKMWDGLWICLHCVTQHHEKMCFFCFNIFLPNLRKQFSPKPWKKSKSVQLLNTFMGCSLKTDRDKKAGDGSWSICSV